MSFDPQTLSALLPGVIEVAHAAGREIMAVYAGDFAVTYKGDRSPLTEADLASQRVIAAGLAKIAPDIPMLGEESAGSEIAARRQWTCLWLVDPLDGTREFVKRNGEFTVNIALIDGHEPVLGVLYGPAQQVLFAGARGCGAFRVDEHGHRRPLHAAQRSTTPPRVLGSRSHRDTSLDKVLARLGTHELLRVGSALKFGWLADGRGDLYVRLSPTCEWDTAAGQAIVEEAGARVVDLHGQPLRYNQRETLINPSFAAWADDSIDWLRLLQ